MVNIFITSKVDRRLPGNFEPSFYISSRKLNKQEISLLRKRNISKYYSPELTQTQKKEFFLEFDRFWDEIISPFEKDHPFWRNAVSSKMQEWERAAPYLMLVMFSLSKVPTNKEINLIVVCSSVEEISTWKRWSENQNWNIISSNEGVKFFEVVIQYAFDFLMFMRYALRCLRKKYFAPKLKKEFHLSPEEKNILLISLFYNKSFKDGKYQDPFFGIFHEYLFDQGYKYMYLSDSINIPDKELKNDVAGCEDVTVPYSLLSWVAVIKVLLRVCFRRLKFNECKFKGCDFSKLLEWNSRRSVNDFNINAEIFFEATSELCRKNYFNQMTFVFEGNAFERGCIQAFRKYSKGSICGYSHAVIYDVNLKLHITELEKKIRPEPDHYVCSGKNSKELLVNIGNRSSSSISEGCSLRNIPENIKDRNFVKGKSHILIALDGVWSCINFLDWLFENRSALDGFLVRIRAHPNVPIQNVLKQCVNNLPENFMISNAALEEDLKNCLCVIYRQTSIGIQALLNAIPVIHLAVDLPLHGDPIKDVNEGKIIAHDAEQLKAAIFEINNLYDENNFKLIDNKEYLNGYFSKPDRDRLKDFILV